MVTPKRGDTVRYKKNHYTVAAVYTNRGGGKPDIVRLRTSTHALIEIEVAELDMNVGKPAPEPTDSGWEYGEARLKRMLELYQTSYTEAGVWTTEGTDGTTYWYNGATNTLSAKPKPVQTELPTTEKGTRYHLIRHLIAQQSKWIGE